MPDVIKPTKKVTISFDVTLNKFTQQGDGGGNGETEILCFEKDLAFLRNQITTFFAGQVENITVEVGDKQALKRTFEPRRVISGGANAEDYYY